MFVLSAFEPRQPYQQVNKTANFPVILITGDVIKGQLDSLLGVLIFPFSRRSSRPGEPEISLEKVTVCRNNKLVNQPSDQQQKSENSR